MKKTIYLALVCGAAMLSGCGGAPKSDATNTNAPAPPPAMGQMMQQQQQQGTGQVAPAPGTMPGR